MAASNKKDVKVIRIVISVVLGFCAVLLLGTALHFLGQDSKQWWLLLLPIWVSVSFLVYSAMPWGGIR